MENLRGEMGILKIRGKSGTVGKLSKKMENIAWCITKSMGSNIISNIVANEANSFEGRWIKKKIYFAGIFVSLGFLANAN